MCLLPVVDPPAIQEMEYTADPPSNPDEKDKNKDKKDEKPPITITMRQVVKVVGSAFFFFLHS